MFERNRGISLNPVVANLVNQSRFVSILTGGLIDESLAAADAVAVSLETSAAASSLPISVSILDGSKVEVECGAAIAAGVRVMSDSTGRAITATGATARVLGWSITATSNAGEVVSIVSSKAAGEFVA